MKAEEAIKHIDDVLNSEYRYDETLGYQLTSDDFEWLEEAKKSLEKQIPKKPVTKNRICYSMSKDGEVLYAYDYYCPLCDVKVNRERHHCPCGQALEWSDTE